ncbi:MAG: hypothetical protein JXR84_19645 [Anaerolineae bacterium]|nr:hypothetical protein [Anaerolineae bacterium]
MSTEYVSFNGINGATGEYLFDPLTPQQISQVVQGEKLDDYHVKELKLRHERDDPDQLGIAADARNLAETGWGVIFAYKDTDEHKKHIREIKGALGELLAHRRAQATQRHAHYYREYIGKEDGYRPGESKLAFLERHGVGPGPADPDKMPYYLLIVGDPETIPYRFQYQLDVQYAVGRIHFDTVQEYAQYACSVVEAETHPPLPRQAAFFGARNPDDRATQRSADELVAPLAQHFNGLVEGQPDWDVRTLLGDDAKKERLARLLGGDETPSFLFSASHGIGFLNGDPRQLPHQGAPLCQNWPGPLDWNGAIPQDFYFAADDVGSDARLLGLLAFFFTCYGAGTPRLDDFAHQAFRDQKAIAPHAFVARLPQRLLSHPQGGALAVVGHVERAWSWSFRWKDAGPQLTVFEAALKWLIKGYPVGAAMEFFNMRYAGLSTELTAELDRIKNGKRPDDMALSSMWTANNDARSYVIIGDPAVRLRVGDTAVAKARSTIEAIYVPSPTLPPVEPASPPKTGIAIEENSDHITAEAETEPAPGDTLGEAAEKIIQYVTDIATMTVETKYVEVDADGVTDLDRTRPIALTTIKLEGDSETIIPVRKQESGGFVADAALLDLHQRNVSAAIEYRTRMLEALLKGLRNVEK